MTDIYHITHVQNLPGVISAGGIWCDRLRAAHTPEAISIAHQHIKDRRARKVVPLAAGGTLADYVPFYFAPRSPMLFTIKQGNVAGRTGGQQPIVHLVSSVEAAVGLDRAWAFTDGHADMALSDFFDDLTALPQAVDWEIMRATYWNDTAEDNDRKRRRQAEFLVHEFFPWTAIRVVGVYNDAMRAEVELALNRSGHKPEIVVKRGWYF